MSETQPTELSPGASLAHGYGIVRRLGAGNMGRVYEAIHLRLKRKCALKQTFYFRPEEATWFQNEAILLSKLGHPSLPKVHDFFEENGNYYLAMDLISGPSLKDLVGKSGARPVAHAIKWLTDILEALAHVHATGIIHRDIKPDNIRMDGERAYLVDFGLAKDMVTGTIVRGHTPGYSAPEQLAGTSTERSDIYSLGATFYHILTGTLPESSANRAKTGATPLKPAHLRNSKVPSWLSAIISKAMALEPANRFESASAMLTALNEREKFNPNGKRTGTTTPPENGESGAKPAGTFWEIFSDLFGGQGNASPPGAKTVNQPRPVKYATSRSRFPYGGCVGLLILIISIAVGVWFFWPRAQWVNVSCDPQWVTLDRDDPTPIELTVEQVGSVKGVVLGEASTGPSLGATRIRLAARILPGNDRVFLPDAQTAYLTDDRGTRYDIRPTTGRDEARSLKRNEIYRYEIEFPPFDHQTPFVYFNHPNFKPILVKIKWDGSP